MNQQLSAHTHTHKYTLFNPGNGTPTSQVHFKTDTPIPLSCQLC